MVRGNEKALLHGHNVAGITNQLGLIEFKAPVKLDPTVEQIDFRAPIESVISANDETVLDLRNPVVADCADKPNRTGNDLRLVSTSGKLWTPQVLHSPSIAAPQSALPRLH